MAKRLYGSICLTDLVELAKSGHSAFSRGKENKKVYININVWENDEPDQFDNTHGITLSSTKEARESGKEKKSIYIGNLKTPKSDATQEKVPVKEGEKVVDDGALDDLPF